MKILNYTMRLLLVIILLAGCSKNVLEETPPNILSGPTILKNYNGFEAALMGFTTWQGIRKVAIGKT